MTMNNVCSYCFAKIGGATISCNTPNCPNGPIKYFAYEDFKLKQLCIVTCSVCNGVGMVNVSPLFSGNTSNTDYIDFGYTCSSCIGLGIIWQEVSSI